MNIYEKLLQARLELRKMELKKSGENSFAKYKYYELSDILPAITEVCGKLKICTSISFTKEEAQLKIINAELPEEVITFASPMVQSDMKGSTAIQSLGAVETYQRRYLYITAFDITEDDPNEKIGDNLSAHNALVIKRRIEQLITDKLSKGKTTADIAKAAGIKENQINQYLNALVLISNMEKKIEIL